MLLKQPFKVTYFTDADKARVKKTKLFQVIGINVKLGGFAAYCECKL